MNENKTTGSVNDTTDFIYDEIEESLRICEELLQNTQKEPLKRPDFDLDELLSSEIMPETLPKEKEQEEIKELPREQETVPEMLPKKQEAIQETLPKKQEAIPREQETVQETLPKKQEAIPREQGTAQETLSKELETVPELPREQKAVQETLPKEQEPETLPKEQAQEISLEENKTEEDDKSHTPKVEMTEQVEAGEEKEEKKKTLRSVLVSLAVCVVIAVAAALLITNFVGNHTTVEGSSMEPALKNEDQLIIEKVSYLMGDPERFDIIVFKYNETTNYIKRIIGLPGETIQIKDEKIYINGRAVFDKYGNGVMTDGGIAEEELVLGNDEYFVLGDNRNASKDSRDSDVGAVKRSQIIGKAWLRIMPFDSFGTIG